MEEASMLRLEITQGPRAGEALVFNPGKKLGIGRIVRGNAVQIKDNGISSKHLMVEFVSGKWIVTDLESSNGTILNDVALDPLVPTVLCDGDVVKIGEFTSISVKFEVVRVEAEGVLVGESNLRRNPRRRAAVKAVASEGVDVVGLKQVRVKEVDVGGVDLDVKKVLRQGEIEEPIAQKRVRGGAARRNDDIADAESLVVEDSDVEMEKKDRAAETGRKGGRSKRGRGGAAKRNALNKVEDNVAELLAVEDSDLNLEKENVVVETGRRRGRPKMRNVLKGEAASVLAGKICNEGQEVKKTRGGRCGVRKGRALKERNGEDESAFVDDKFTEVATDAMEASHDGEVVLINGRDLNKRSTEDESATVDGNCNQPLQNVPPKDGFKMQTRGRPKRAQLAGKEVMKEVTAEKLISISGCETQVDSVNIKKEKVSICPSAVPVSQLESHEPLENLGVEKTIEADTFEPLAEAGIHVSIQEKEDVSRSHKETDTENSRNEILPNTLNIKQEKRSLPPELCLKRDEVEFADNIRLENEDSKKSDEPESLGSHNEAHHELKLEEMTLGQWFDYLEVYLPKKIHDSTEEMIASMIEKSKRYKEYVSQRQKEIVKVLPRQGS